MYAYDKYSLFLFIVSIHAKNRSIDSLAISTGEANGYTLKERLRVPVTRWEDSLFSTDSIISYSFKAVKPVPDNQKTFARFTLEIYFLSDTILAEKRYLQNSIRPSKLKPEQNKTWPLQTSFISGNCVFVFKTDVALIYEYLLSVSKVYVKRIRSVK